MGDYVHVVWVIVEDVEFSPAVGEAVGEGILVVGWFEFGFPSLVSCVGEWRDFSLSFRHVEELSELKSFFLEVT